VPKLWDKILAMGFDGDSIKIKEEVKRSFQAEAVVRRKLVKQ